MGGRPPALALLLTATLAGFPAAADSPPAEEDWGNEPAPPSDDWGDDSSSTDDTISFDESDLTLEAARALSLTGFIRSDWGFWLERFGDDPPPDGRAAWSKGRQSLDLVLTGKQDFFRFRLAGHGEYDLRYLGDQAGSWDDFDDATEETYGWQILLREAFGAFSLGPVELTIGRQIVAFGEGDALSPLDVVNPRDNREPGLADLDDIRLAVLATRLAVFAGNHRVELMVIHEADFGLRSPPLGPCSAFNEVIPDAFRPLLVGKDVRFVDLQDRFDIELQQPLLRWVYKGPELDAGVYAAYVLDKQGTFAFPDAASVVDPTVKQLSLELDHQSYGVVGTSGAWAWDSLLVKWELGAQIQRAINVGDAAALPPRVEVERHSLIDVMVGLTYTPFSDLQLALEFQKSTFVTDADEVLFPIDLPIFALRMNYQLLNQRLTLGAAVSMFGLTSADEIGVLARASVDYEFIDGLQAGIGFIHYTPSDTLGPLSGLSTHDQLFLKLRWDFTVL